MFPQTVCPDRDRLQQLLAGDLSSDAQGELSRHLDDCEPCRQALDELAGGGPWLGAVTDDDEPVPNTVVRRGLDAYHDEPAADADFALDFLDPPTEPEQLGRFAGYDVHEVLGRGGMGVVLKAFDPALHRFVAIKVLAPQLATSAAARRRFAREAQAAAAVTHDHVVAIHAVDEVNGLPYLVMQYVAGPTLQQRLDEKGPFEVKEILRIGMQAAYGLAAAHAQGLIHRDIKPGNILLENGVQRVKITDFGLARAVDDVTLTQNGVVAGTPEYMAPEQARGEALDPRADVFSLGSVLYAMATGRPPFRADNTPAVLRRVEEETPRPVRDVNPDVPGWLATVIEKLHAKRPADRYQTAAEVADVLRQCLAHVQQPALVPLPASGAALAPRAHSRGANATPLGVRRWALAAAALLLALGGLAVTEATGQTQLAKRIATVLRIRTPDGVLVVEVDDPQVKVTVDNDGQEVVITGAGVQELRLRPGQHRLTATKDGKTVQEQVVSVSRDGREVVRVRRERDGPAAANTADQQRLYAEQVRAAQSALEAKRYQDELRTLRDQIDRLLSEKKALETDQRRYFETARTAIDTLLTEQASKLLGEKVQKQEQLSQWNTAMQKLEVEANGVILVQPTSTADWHTASQQGPPAVFTGHTDAVNCVAFSPDGSLIASAGSDGTVRLWHVGSVSETRRFVGHRSATTSAAFSPDGRRIVSAGSDAYLRIWDIATGQQICNVPKKPEGQTCRATFSPDGRAVLTVGDDNTVRLWDAQAGRPRAQWEQSAFAITAVFSPNGQSVLMGGRDGSVRLFDAQSGKLLRKWTDSIPVNAVAFSFDGKLILTAGGRPGDPGHGADFAVRLYDAATGKELRRFAGHTAPVASVAFAPDGHHFVSGSYDKSVRLWHVASGTEVLRLEGNAAEVNWVAFSPDGKQIASASNDKTIRHWWIKRLPAEAASRLVPTQPNPLPALERAMHKVRVSLRMQNGKPVVQLDGSAVEATGLVDKLRSYARQIDLVLEVDKDVPYAEVVKVQDAIKAAGVTKVNLQAKP